MRPVSKEKEKAALAVKRTYEVQRHVQGRWTVDTVSDDREVALELAKEMLGAKRPPAGVRVMSVELTDSGKFSETSIFRSTMSDQSREGSPSRYQAPAKAAIKSEIRDFKHMQQPRPPERVASNRLQHLVRVVWLAFGVAATLVTVELLIRLMRHS